MQTSLTHSNNLTPIDLECPFFQVYHFCMLENKKLSGDEAKELLDHINECKPCQNLHNEIKAVFAGSAENKPSRVELLTYLKCSMNQITSLTEELHAKFLLRHRLKAKKRMSKAENRIRELEKQVAQLQAQVHELLKAANPPTLKAPDDLECSDLQIHHFLMYLTNELSRQEKKQLTNHVRECKPCENAFDEVKNIFSCKKRPTRKEQLTFLSNLASRLWTLQTSKLKAELKMNAFTTELINRKVG